MKLLGKEAIDLWHKNDAFGTEMKANHNYIFIPEFTVEGNLLDACHIMISIKNSKIIIPEEIAKDYHDIEDKNEITTLRFGLPYKQESNRKNNPTVLFLLGFTIGNSSYVSDKHSVTRRHYSHFKAESYHFYSTVDNHVIATSMLYQLFDLQGQVKNSNIQLTSLEDLVSRDKKIEAHDAYNDYRAMLLEVDEEVPHHHFDNYLQKQLST